MALLRWIVLAGFLASAGCGAASTRGSTPEEDPAGDQRLRETLQISARGPTQWHPVVTIIFYPVLLVADTSIKLTGATARCIRAILFGVPVDLPIPAAVERSAERTATDR
jgi:hypothetical protein